MRTALRGLLSLSCFVVGCSPDAVTNAVPAASQEVRFRSAPGATTTFDDELLAFERAYPGFSGVYVDSAGAPVVRFVSTPSPDAVRAARDFLMSHGGAGIVREGVPTRIQLATVPFSELVRQRQAVLDNVVRERLRIALVDADEVANAVVVGVATSADSALAAASLGRLRLSNLSVVVVGVVRTLQNTLRNDVPPIRGGMGISTASRRFSSSFPHDCTLGFTARYLPNEVNVPVFVTNAHCTAVPNAIDNELFYQPGSGRVVGQESYEPAPYQPSGCPAGQLCRMSDAALVTISEGQWWLATIANTGAPHSLTEPLGVPTPSFPYPLAIVDQDTVVNHIFGFNVAPGVVVRKQGATTGTTQGPITRSCIYFLSPMIGPLVCQYEARAYANSGDSGSPVYTWQPLPPFLGGPAVLHGLLHSGRAPNSVAPTSHFFYSPISGVYADLGYLQPF